LASVKGRQRLQLVVEPARRCVTMQAERSVLLWEVMN